MYNLNGKRVSFVFGRMGELFGTVKGDGTIGGVRYLDVRTVRNPGSVKVYLISPTNITGIE